MDVSSEIKSRYYALVFTISLHAILFLLFLSVVFIKPEQKVIAGAFSKPGNLIGLELDAAQKDDIVLKQQTRSSSIKSAITGSQNKNEMVSRVTDPDGTDLNAATCHKRIKQSDILNEQPQEDLENALMRFGKIKKAGNSNSANNETKITGSDKLQNADSPQTISSEIILSGRKSIRIPDGIKDFNEEGKVVVAITVDEMGNVISAIPGQRGSTTTSSILYEKAEAIVIQAKFSQSENGIKEQRGTYTLVFALQ